MLTTSDNSLLLGATLIPIPGTMSFLSSTDTDMVTIPA